MALDAAIANHADQRFTLLNEIQVIREHNPKVTHLKLTNAFAGAALCDADCIAAVRRSGYTLGGYADARAGA